MSFDEWSNNKKKKKPSSFEEWSNASRGISKKQEEEDEKKRQAYLASRHNDDDDIAPVGGNKDSWFKSGGFSDGVDSVGDFFGDLGQTVGGTLGDLGIGIVKGAGRMVEGLADLGTYGVAQVGEWLGEDEFAEKARGVARYSAVDEWTKPATDFVDRYSVLGNKADMVSEGLGQVGAIILTGGASAAAGLGKLGVTAATTAVTGLSSMGSNMNTAYEEGADDGEAFWYGLGAGAVEAGTELLFGGLGKGVKALGLSRGIGGLDDIFAKRLSSAVTKAITNESVQKITGNTIEAAIKAGGEGAEEVLSGLGSAVMKKLTYEDDETLGKLIEDENLLEQFVVGAITSSIAQGADFVKANKSGRDFVTGYTNSEQAVIDKEVERRVSAQEKGGKKLTTKEISAIEEQVQSDMEHGQLDIEMIDEVLGGESYKAYKDTVKSEDDLKAEYDQLANIRKSDLTTAQEKRLAELESMNLGDTTKRDELRKKLNDTVFPQLKDSKLAESYNQVAKKGEAFKADLNKYSGKQREAVERAVKSGVLNDTYRSHELVDVLSKIEATKGITFDYTNNAKLKESGFAVEDKTVNGYADKNTGSITLNVQSAKAWQSVVGHEITHVLEGTEAYGALQNALYAYANSKGELDSRRASLTELYQNIGADVESELTADLVGDYLFTDKAFVDRLMGNRNLFQKVWDEIKYLCRVATGKERASMEKVEREFARAWKEMSAGNKAANKESGKTQYSLDAVEAVQPKSGKWARTHTTEEAMAVFPDMWNVSAEESEVRNPTQITSTVNTYRKIYNLLQDEGFGGKILDASSGLGYGTRAGVEEYGFDVEDIEPYPDANYKPKYQDYSSLDEKYDVIISNAVLNVLPQDQRDALAVKMGELLNDGGRLFVNVRGKDVESLAKTGKNIHLGNMEWIETVKGSYQKGFTKPELVAYLQDALGDGFTVEPTNAFGGVAAVVTKDGGKAQYSVSDSASKSGVEYDKASESYSPVQYSISSWDSSDYVAEREKASADMAKNLGVTKERAAEYIDSVNSIAKIIADDKERLSYEPSPGRSAFVSNAEYGGSIDFSTICKKRRLFTGTFEAIQNALPNTALTADEVLEIRKMMKDKGYEVSCGLCYVEGSRTNMGTFTKQFIERYAATNPEYVPNMAEMNTASGQEMLRKEHPEVYEAYEYFMNHYGRLAPTDKALFASQQKPKMYQMATEYKGEILKKFGGKTKSVAEKNKNGGLRLQSFSDFEIIHLIDSMHVIMDMSRAGLAGQAYTKVPDFAWALGDTGLKINLSLIAKDVDADGRLILDEVEGMKEADAMALRDRYSDNVGTIIVVFTDAQLKAAMADERIDYIIPYHRSQWKTSQYEAMGLPANTQDYTPWQNESYIEDVFDKNGKKRRPSNYMPNAYWDFSKSGKENAEAYLAMCAENNRKPKFSHLLVDNGDGSYSLQPDGSTDGYWKTLIDFKMYNNDGVGVPQNPVVPNFNMEEARRMLNEYTGGHAKFPVAQDIVDEFVSKHPDNIAPVGVQYSLSADDVKAEAARFVSQNSNEYGDTWGIRVDNYDYGIGDTMYRSHELYQDAEYDDDGELIYPEGEGVYSGFYDAGELDGTSTIGINPHSSNLETVIAKALKRSKQYAYHDTNYLYIVSGEDGYVGNDIGESIISDAVVRKKYRINDDGTYEDMSGNTSLSLSEEGEEYAPVGNYSTPLRELALKDVAPVAEDAPTTEAPMLENIPVLPDDELEYGTYEAITPEEEEVPPSDVIDKPAFFSDKASALYEEVRSMRKGKRVSRELGYLLDHLDLSEENKNESYTRLKTALINIKNRPDQMVNERSEIESLAREMIGEAYDEAVYEIDDLVAKRLKAVQDNIARNESNRKEAFDTYEQQIAQKQAELDSKKNKNTVLANNLRMQIERLKRLRDTTDAQYANSIEKLAERAKKMQDPKYSRAMHKRAKMEADAKWAEDLLGDTSTWVDKKIGLQYATNTERRNLRDIVRDGQGKQDIARADAIDDALGGQYNREQYAKNRELAQVRGKYAELKITKAEDAYIQMLGELRHNPDTTLTEETVREYYEAHKNKIDTAKVDRVIELARQDYDTMFDRLNAELREQGMREIPYRQGYFPHFTEPKQNFVQRLLNWKTQDNEIPTSIAGLTETFKPVRTWQAFDKTRHGDETDYSFMKGFDAYSDGALDWIYHMDTLQKRRAVENHIRYTHSSEGIQKRIDAVYSDLGIDADEAQAQIEAILAEGNNPLNNFVQDFTTHTNILAGKKNTLDRTVEQWTNRHIYSVMTNVQNRLSANMVAGNVRSALTNFIPITQSWAQVSPARSLQAAKDTIANTFRNDGVVDKSTFLTNRLKEADKLYQSNWDKVIDKAGVMFEIVDNFTSQVVWRSKYNQNIAHGMTESAAIANADQFAENVMAGRSKGNEPTLFNAKNPLIKAFTAFQLEVNNQYGYFFKDVPNDLKAETNHWKFNLVKGYTTAFIGAHIYNALLEKVTGSEAAFDPIGIVEELLKDLGLFGEDDEKEPKEALENLKDNVLEQMPFVGGYLGGGRLPISTALPIKELVTGKDSYGNEKPRLETIAEAAPYTLMPFGYGQLKKTYQGLNMFSDEHPVSGSYTDSGNLRFPVEDTPLNRAQAAIFGQYASENAREYFDKGYAPLNEKQIQEYIDVDMPIKDYREYREGLKGLTKTEEKFDYISGLDLPIGKKNILANNAVDRKEPVDLTNYNDFSGLEEFDFATKNPEKYAFAKSVGGYSAYQTYSDDLNNIRADKDASGKSISGSRKEKVLQYINNLDADYYTKIILYKSEYPSDDTYNSELVNYITNQAELTYEERVAVLTKLGFRVAEDGQIYAD